MFPISGWALTLSFWVHMLATVAWLGGLAALVLLVIPNLQRNLGPKDFAAWLGSINKRLDSIGWLSLGLLTFTGLVQMDANPNYLGLFNFSNPWSQAICLKHVAFSGMIGVSAYITWVLTPAFEHAVIRRASGKPGNDAPKLAKRLETLIWANLILGALVLVFTALARTA